MSEDITPKANSSDSQPTPDQADADKAAADREYGFGGLNSAEVLRDAYQKAKDDAGGSINISMNDISQGVSEIPATFRSVRRGRKYTGGQIFLWGAFFFSLYVGFGGSEGFSLLAFLIMFGFLWLVSAPFRMAGWAIRRANSRPCPVCGIRVANGETQCQSCGTDFTIR
jgi:hypothetical protein